MLSTVLPALCSAFNFNKKNVNTLIARKLSGFTCTRSLTINSNFQYRTRQSLLQYLNYFSLIVSELVQVNPDTVIHSLSALTCN